MILWHDGVVTVEEVKGKYHTKEWADEALRPWRRNAKQVKELYRIDVTLVQL